MDAERFARIKRLLSEVEGLAPAERAAFLDKACSGEPEVRSEIESILSYEHDSLGFATSLAAHIPGRVTVRGSPTAGDSNLPERIQRYQVIEEIGRGGMGIVYRAWDPDLEREVALKVLPAPWIAHPDRVARFAAEARLLASINHPNIAAIHGIEQDGDVPFLSMELVDGRSLEAMIADGPMALGTALPIARQIASALEAAHARGVIHRDVKPLNVMVGADGRVKMLDFGIAKALWGEEAWPRSLGAKTSVPDPAGVGSGIAGTPGYMSPEQVMGEPVSARTDVWSFGCLLYTCLAGRRPFEGETAAELIRASLDTRPRLDRLPESTPPVLAEMIERCLERDPARRIASMSAVRRAVIQAMEDLELEQLGVDRIEADRIGDSTGSIRSNLPRRLTTFIGRERERREVAALLAESRLVTLVGVGGCGKTRLSLEVAAGRANDYPDGVWQVELVTLRASASVPQAVMSALGLEQRSGKTVVETVVAHLQDKRMLVILDNCEHVLYGCALLITSALQASPHLRILATSRERLGLDGERVYAVPPLSIDDDGDEGRAGAGDAIELFVDRACSANPSFEFTESNRTAVVEICRRVDGLPLALELSAARVKSMSVDELAAGLRERLAMLAGGDGTMVPRHQTLRGVIDWSHDQLDTSAREVLRRLSVFTGGWTLEAAEVVCVGGAIEEWECLDVLTRLVDKSLIQRDVEGGKRGGQARYRMLETVREYAGERLEEAGEVNEVRSRHRDYYLALTETEEPELRGPSPDRSLRQLQIEHENVLAALDWTGDPGDGTEKAFRLAASIWWYWHLQGHFSLGREILTRVLGNDAGRPHDPHRAALLHAAGTLAEAQGDLEAARRCFEESLAIHRRLGDRSGMAAVISGQGNLARARGDYASARALYEESLHLRRELDDRRGIARSLSLLGRLAFGEGDLASAEALQEESLEIRRQLEDLGAVASSLGNLANIKFAQGKYQEGMALLEESLEKNRRVGDRRGIAALLNNLGTVKYQQGDYESAQKLHAESLEVKREIGDPGTILSSLVACGQVAGARGDHARGTRLLARAAAMREWAHGSLNPKDRAEIEATVTGLRKALGDEAFSREWAAGSSLSMDEAIALALGKSGE